MNRPAHTIIRDTSAQDIVRAPRKNFMRHWKPAAGAVIALVLAVVGYSVLSRWLASDVSISSQRIRTALVERGSLVRDVNVQGRIVAATSPTLYSPASGTVTLSVQAGDQVKIRQVLAQLISPEVQSEFEQESSGLAASQAEYARQRIQARTRRRSRGKHCGRSEGGRERQPAAHHRG